jgi:thioredoxin-related protein
MVLYKTLFFTWFFPFARVGSKRNFEIYFRKYYETCFDNKKSIEPNLMKLLLMLRIVHIIYCRS